MQLLHFTIRDYIRYEKELGEVPCPNFPRTCECEEGECKEQEQKED